MYVNGHQGKFPFISGRFMKNCIEYIKKILHSVEGDFKILVKSGIF